MGKLLQIFRNSLTHQDERAEYSPITKKILDIKKHYMSYGIEHNNNIQLYRISYIEQKIQIR